MANISDSLCSPKSNRRKGCLPLPELKSITNVLPEKDIKFCKSKHPVSSKDSQNLCLLQKAVETNNNAGDFRDLLNKHFKPKSPQSWKQKPNTWLSNFDIEKVLEQYKTKKNVFLGVSAIDFENACGYFGFNHCSFKPEMSKKYFMVINLSKHDESGTHWVALTMDTHINSLNYGAMYFDSYGSRPTSEIKNFVKRCHSDLQSIMKTKKYSKSLINKDFPLNYNRIQMQTSNSECGIYCLSYIHLFLNCKKGEDYHILCDKLRSVFPKIDKINERGKFFIL